MRFSMSFTVSACHNQYVQYLEQPPDLFCTCPFTLCSAKLARNRRVFVSFCIYMPVFMRSCIHAYIRTCVCCLGMCVYLLYIP